MLPYLSPNRLISNISLYIVFQIKAHLKHLYYTHIIFATKKKMVDIPVFVTSEYTSSERRLSPSWTVAQLKQKLEPITGIPPESQKLFVYPKTSMVTPASSSLTSAIAAGTASNLGSPPYPLKAETPDASTTLEQFVSSGILGPYVRVDVLDLRPSHDPERKQMESMFASSSFGAYRGSNGEEGEEEEKYVMPLSEYEKREDSVLQWKKANKLGRFSSQEEEQATRERSIELEKLLIEKRGIKVGARCKVTPANGSTESYERLGTVRFVGEVPEINNKKGAPPGAYWVGVEFDEPVGKNDGSIGGTRYFQVKSAKYGSFVKPANVEIGDFPEESLFDDDDDDEL